MFASRLQILDRAKTWAFPPDCLRCGDRVEIPYGLCGPCWAEARFANLDEALALTPRHGQRLRGRAVILIDDVMTSGATLWSATHALRLGGAGPIYVLVMARATKAA